MLVTVDINLDDILEPFDINEIVDYCGLYELLKEIGKEAAMEYFDLVEKE